jgi:hypothetical protein
MIRSKPFLSVPTTGVNSQIFRTGALPPSQRKRVVTRKKAKTSQNIDLYYNLLAN